MAQSKASPNARQGEQEKPLPPLNPRERKFVAHYSVHFNGAEAVRLAGYETEHPRNYAYELLTKPHIQAHVERVRKELGTLHYDIYNRAVSKLDAMMNADRAQIFTPEGVLKDIDDWPEECKLLLAGVEVEELWEGRGDERRAIGNLRKVKLEAPKGIIDSIAKITGNIVERHQMLDKEGRPVDPALMRPLITVTVAAPPKGKR